jgi:hypothetical protein
LVSSGSNRGHATGPRHIEAYQPGPRWEWLRTEDLLRSQVHEIERTVTRDHERDSVIEELGGLIELVGVHPSAVAGYCGQHPVKHVEALDRRIEVVGLDGDECGSPDVLGRGRQRQRA